LTLSDHTINIVDEHIDLAVRVFTEFAASRPRKSLPADLAKLSEPKTSAGRTGRRSSRLIRGRSLMHDKNNSNSRGKTTGAALDRRLSYRQTARATSRKWYSKTNWTP
jgi:hypothetical protein